MTESSGDEHYINRDVVSLEVGDEIYAFEKYTPRSREVDGVWFRGYVARSLAAYWHSKLPQICCLHDAKATSDLVSSR